MGLLTRDNKYSCPCPCNEGSKIALHKLLTSALDGGKSKASNPITGLDRPRGFQEVEAPRFHGNQHVKVVRLSA